MIGWEYIAGFFDGEGCVFQFNKSMPYKYWQVCITQKDRSILDKIQKFVGYGTVSQESDQKYNWHRYKIFKQERVLDFLLKIFPYVIVKKEQVREILENPWKRQTSWNKGKQNPMYGTHHIDTHRSIKKTQV